MQNTDLENITITKIYMCCYYCPKAVLVFDEAYNYQHAEKLSKFRHVYINCNQFVFSRTQETRKFHIMLKHSV